MKIKLLLILSLVLPSLCFGKSVKIAVTQKVPDKMAKTIIGIEMTGEKNFKVEFLTKRNPLTPEDSSYVDMYIPFKENKAEITDFLEFCAKHFSVSFVEQYERYIEGKTRFMDYNFTSFFESLLIQNDFAITYKDEVEVNNLINGHTIFFYKPD